VIDVSTADVVAAASRVRVPRGAPYFEVEKEAFLDADMSVEDAEEFGVELKRSEDKMTARNVGALRHVSDQARAGCIKLMETVCS
jgi:hypothetical protein